MFVELYEDKRQKKTEKDGKRKGNVKVNYKILLQYDGTRYEGWQRQERTGQTIQGKIEAVLSKMTGEEIQIQGAGRTDAGVHAKGQTANFHLKRAVDVQELKRYLNHYLPEDIAVTEVCEAPERFHSRLNASGKIYTYRIATGEEKNVFERRYIYDLGERPDTERMRQAAQLLTGTHDFRSFCANKRMKKSTVRTIYEIKIEEMPGEILLTYKGNGFLHHMIRILTGTLLEVGMGRRSLSSVKELLEVFDREKAGFTAPAKGLTLEEVLYSPLQKENETL